MSTIRPPRDDAMNATGKKILLDALNQAARAYAMMNAADEAAAKRVRDHVRAIVEACRQAGCTDQECREATAGHLILAL